MGVGVQMEQWKEECVVGAPCKLPLQTSVKGIYPSLSRLSVGLLRKGDWGHFTDKISMWTGNVSTLKPGRTTVCQCGQYKLNGPRVQFCIRQLPIYILT